MMNGGGGDELSAIVDQCTWSPVSATNKSESIRALGKLIQEFSHASSTSLTLHDVVQIGTSHHQNPQPVSINRSESDQLALEKLAQELSVSNITSTPSLLPPLTTLSLNEIVEISHQRFDQNPHFSAGIMTRSESEMALDKLVEELSATASSSMVPQLPPVLNNDNMMKLENLQHAQASSSDVYSVLKSKLNMACAAAAVQLGVGSFTYPQNRAQAEQDLEPAPESEIDIMQRKRKVQIRQIISDVSSKEESETIEQMDPQTAKRARRLEVNRNSARSYRRRRKSQIKELQVEIDKLMEEHGSMASDFSKMQKKHNDALVENEKLKDEIGTLTTRVNEVEEKVERLMKLNPMFILNFRTHGGGEQFVGSQANHGSSTVLSMRQNSIQQAHRYNDNAPSSSSLQRVANIYFLDNSSSNNNNNNNNVAIKAQINGSRISTVSNNESGNDMAFMQGRHFFG